jgi:hypothetical protein
MNRWKNPPQFGTNHGQPWIINFEMPPKFKT